MRRFTDLVRRGRGPNSLGLGHPTNEQRPRSSALLAGDLLFRTEIIKIPPPQVVELVESDL